MCPQVGVLARIKEVLISSIGRATVTSVGRRARALDLRRQGFPPSCSQSNESFRVALQVKKKPPPKQGLKAQKPEGLAVVFVELASLAIDQGWIGRAEMPHQAVLVAGRQGSV